MVKENFQSFLMKWNEVRDYCPKIKKCLKYIVIEGIDGSGKDTIINSLKKYLIDNYNYLNIINVREPSHSIISNNKFDRGFKFAEDRIKLSISIKEFLKNKNNVIISNRSIISSYAYQTAEGICPFFTFTVNKNCTPYLGSVFILDISSENSLLRVNCRGKGDLYDTADIKFKNNTRFNYLRMAALQNYHIVDASLSKNEVFDGVVDRLLKDNLF